MGSVSTSAPVRVALPSSSSFSAAKSSPSRAGGTGKAGEDAREAAVKFEQLLLFELLKTMRKTVPVSENGGDGFARSTLDSMFDQAMAEASSGSLGIAPMLARQFDQNQAAPELAPLSTLAPRPLSFAPLPPAPPAPPRNTTVQVQAAASGTFGGSTPQPGDLPVDGRLSSRFGWRIHPISQERKFHGGIDLAAPEGTEVHAVQDGTVTFSGRRPGYGKTVEVMHADGTLGRYAHSSRLHVSVGDRVEVGETIADVGSTGSATGPHVHLEIRRNGHPIDPSRYLHRLRESAKAATTERRVGVLVGETG